MGAIEPYDRWARTHMAVSGSVSEAQYKEARTKEVRFKVYGERPANVTEADRLVGLDRITDPNAPWYALHFANIGIGSVPVPRNPITQKVAAAVALAGVLTFSAWKEFSTSVGRPEADPVQAVQKEKPR